MNVEKLKLNVNVLKQVIDLTAKLLGKELKLWDIMKYLETIKNTGKVVFEVAPNIKLILSPDLLGQRMKIELDASGASYPVKEEWLKQVKALAPDFELNNLGSAFGVPQSDVVKLHDIAQEVKPILVQTDLGQIKIEPLTLFFCPHCGSNLPDKDSDQCPKCEEQIWRCQRCRQFISQDPDDLDECPRCHGTFKTVECPFCQHDIFADLSKCSNCKRPLTVGTCPNCTGKVIVGNDINECPYCQLDIALCPRCGKYIAQEDDEFPEKCPLCKETLLTDECPNCGKQQLVGSEKCSNCGTGLITVTCPNDDCSKSIFWDNENTNLECPHCSADITPAECPECNKKFYLAG